MIGPCRNQCTHCSSRCSSTGRINRRALTDLLVWFFTGKERVPSELVRLLKSKKEVIYDKRDPMYLSKSMGTIHATCLQLLAVGIIELRIHDKKKHLIGKSGLIDKDIIVRLASDGMCLRIVRDEYWERVSLTPSE